MKKYKNTKVLKIIGEKIRELRNEKELEIEDIVEMTSFSPKKISDLENGSETSLSYFIAVCFALEIHPKEILNFPMDIKPIHPLTPGRKEKSRLTYRISKYIKDGYFQTPRSTDEVVKKLYEDYKVDMTSRSVSAVLGRLLKSTKKGNKNLYSSK
ncbi:helix-turn-helix domain-containing protein [Sinomicrobium oceani]|uniref:helix-turn-helix domain-containing protein n=1 Tax=Sinomicrobium oceani TaxID=1150368 RepID=UPI00227C60CF|nr:helix-turn-helix transcriptional regulator [Sinomicrobium oceani]